MKNLFLLLALLLPLTANANSIAYAKCNAYAVIVSNAASWKLQGLPISVPLNTIKNVAYDDEYLYVVLRESIEQAYANPEKMLNYVENGDWSSFCEQAVLNPQKYFYRKY